MNLEYYSDVERIPPDAIKDTKPILYLSADEVDYAITSCGLSSEQIEVVELIAKLGWSRRDVAYYLRITRGAVQYRLRGAQKKISDKIRKNA